MYFLLCLSALCPSHRPMRRSGWLMMHLGRSVTWWATVPGWFGCRLLKPWWGNQNESVITYVGSVNFNGGCLMLATQGSMLQVSHHFLEQTLDKKLMSDLRVSMFRFVFCFHQNKSDVFVSFDLSVFRGSAQLTNEPKSSSHPESSPLAGSGPMMPPKRNWTPTPSTSSPRGPAVLSSTASRTRCLVSVKSVCVFV